MNIKVGHAALSKAPADLGNQSSTLKKAPIVLDRVELLEGEGYKGTKAKIDQRRAFGRKNAANVASTNSQV